MDYARSSDVYFNIEGISVFGQYSSAMNVPERTPRQGDWLLTYQRDVPWFPPAFAGIRFGQRLVYHGERSKHARWNHAALFIDDAGHIAEALNSGVAVRHIDEAYLDREYAVVYMAMDDLDREQVANYALDRVGDRYGWLVIANIAARLLVPVSKLSYHIEGQDICSALVAQALRAAGYTFKGYDPGRIMPADLSYLADVP